MRFFLDAVLKDCSKRGDVVVKCKLQVTAASGSYQNDFWVANQIKMPFMSCIVDRLYEGPQLQFEIAEWVKRFPDSTVLHFMASMFH